MIIWDGAIVLVLAIGIVIGMRLSEKQTIKKVKKINRSP